MTGKQRSQFIIDTEVINCQYYSPNGRFVACGTTEGDLVLRDSVSGNEVVRMPSDAAVDSVVFLPDKRRILTGLGGGFTRFEDLDKPPKVSRDQFLVRLLDAQSKTEIWRLPGHKFAVKAVAVSADSRRAASGCEGAQVLVWDVATGKKLRQFKQPNGMGIRSLAFSPDGRSLLVAPGEVGQWDPVERERELAQIERGLAQRPSSPPAVDEPRETEEYEDRHALRLYDLETEKWIRKFRGHAGPLGAVAFFPDGRRILSGGPDQTLRIWEVASGQELTRLEGHQRPICCIALSRDGTLALSGDYDGEVRLWKLAK